MKDQIKVHIENQRDRYYEISQYIGHHPELGHQEFKAAKTLTDELSQQGFKVTMGTCGLDTAFEAVYDSGKPGAKIGFMAEYDALPELGHACGHNLIGTMAIAAGIGLSKAISETGGAVYVYGTPAEETTGAKVNMSDEGVLSHLDAAMMVHPSAEHMASGSSLAMDAIQFEFFGRASHAANSPHKGINALDAVIQTFNSINALREHLPSDVRIHGIITDGGYAANIVPDYAKAQFYVRSAKRSDLNTILEKVKNCAKGASLATGARLESSFYEFSYDDMNTNETLSGLFTSNVLGLGVTKDEIKKEEDGGSLDMGNVSQVVPSIHPYVKISDTNCDYHTHEFREAALSQQGFEGLMLGATSMALTGYDLMTKPELLKQVKDEFEAWKNK
ncbi:M20 family metallopeptidase [Alkalicoccobacillus murimartini]|uniref:Peptidase M20 domain-containing protein 2 n=1 Tax=Alkalicoccobacillus murimartini TaxID=171685 RepID=A0ABT9YC86_9BACI|nr:M20 family metallopeptidase [Alkalicoccobacillus murimartini]MDQ0205463.1 amidohydrolase [Alkalicoccobacillus murimartini]